MTVMMVRLLGISLAVVCCLSCGKRSRTGGRTISSGPVTVLATDRHARAHDPLIATLTSLRLSSRGNHSPRTVSFRMPRKSRAARSMGRAPIGRSFGPAWTPQRSAPFTTARYGPGQSSRRGFGRLQGGSSQQRHYSDLRRRVQEYWQPAGRQWLAVGWIQSRWDRRLLDYESRSLLHRLSFARALFTEWLRANARASTLTCSRSTIPATCQRI